jgi:WD40 repeat protein
VTRHPSEVLDLAVGGGQVASTEENLAVTLSTPATDHRLRTLGARTDRVGRAVAVAVSPDGGTAAVSVGANIQLWPLGPGGAPRVLAAPATVTGLAYAPDGRSLAVRTGTELVVIDPASGRATLRLGLDSSDSLEGSDSVAFAPDGKLVVTDGPDGEYVADLRSGTWATTLPAERAGLAGSADRSVLAVPTQLYTPVAGGSQVSLLRWPGPTPYRTVTENALLRELALSPTGDRMAAADLDERVITWTTTDGRRTVLPSVGSTGQLAFAAGGTLLFGWTDLSGVLSVWDPVNSAAIGAWTVDTPSFAPSSVPVSSTAIAATPAGLLTGHWDGHLTLWNTRVEYWAATLCTLAGGDLTPAERTTYLADTPVPPACP